MFSTDIRIQSIFEFAREKHKNQKRLGGLDYITHPISVSDIIVAHNIFDIRLIIISLLHDVLEDTDATVSNLLELGVTADELEAIILLTKEPNYNMEQYIYRISQNYLALTVKLADRLHNLKSALEKGVSTKFRNKYILETEQYYLELSKGTVFEESITVALHDLKNVVKYKIKGV